MSILPAAQRDNCHLEVYCQPVMVLRHSDLWWQAIACQITHEKIRLISTRRYENQTFICIEFPDRMVGARVAAGKQRPEGDWLIDAAFVNPLSTEDVRAIIKSGQRAPATNRRR